MHDVLSSYCFSFFVLHFYISFFQLEILTKLNNSTRTLSNTWTSCNNVRTIQIAAVPSNVYVGNLNRKSKFFNLIYNPKLTSI